MRHNSDPTYRIIKVLIASPGDMEDEREIISKAMIEWNGRHVGDGIALVPLMFERHVLPLAGAEDPQSVVNDQLVDVSDCGIALFHSRLGTPTPRASSGTVEEIFRLIERRKPVAVFFDVSDVSIDIDVEEFTRVRQLRDSFTSRVGGLYHSFKGRSELEKSAYAWIDSLVVKMKESDAFGSRKVKAKGKMASAENEKNIVEFGRYPQTVVSLKRADRLERGDASCWLRDASAREEYARVIEASPYGRGRGRHYSNGTEVERGVECYFKVEPIKWRVMAETEKTLVLLSEVLLDHAYYLDRQYVFPHGGMMLNHYGVHPDGVWANNWEYSSLRFWLNGEWLNSAFSWSERTHLVKMRCDNSSDSGCIRDVGEKLRHNGNPTDDYVCIPSYAEVVSGKFGFLEDAKQSDPRRICRVSDYAIARGVEAHDGAGGNLVGWWWLRSPANFADYYPDGLESVRGSDAISAEENAKKCAQLRVCDVMEDGRVCTRGSIVDGFHSVTGVEPCDGASNGVRPMIEVRKSAFSRNE